MIEVADKIFCISGKNFTYSMYINGAGYLQHAYYGKSMDFADTVAYISEFCRKYEPQTGDINADMAFDYMPSEYGFFARGDYREPAVISERADGAAMSRLRYVSHRIYEGAPALDGLPHARGGGQTLEIILKDDFSSTEICLNYTVFGDCGALVRNSRIINTGKSPIVLKRAFSCGVDFPRADYKLLCLHGKWAGERTPEITQIGHGIRRLQSIRGASSHQLNPFAAILSGVCGEDEGECYGIQLVYSGNFAITAELNSEGQVRLQGGINDTAFSWELGENQAFTTPQAVLCYSDEGLGGLSREYADFIRLHIVNPEFVYKRRPIVVNNWEATYFDFNEQKLFSMIDGAAELGIDTFVLDDGWFGKRNSDNGSLGDWTVNREKLKGGLTPVIDRCKKNGLKFGIWFEPEAISEDSDLYRTHPDWAIGRDGVEPARWRNQLVLDFTRTEVVVYIFTAVSKILSENEISYVKWDFNRSISEFYSRTLKRQGEFAHRYILGVYRLAERLTRTFADVFFEGCAGGGGRFDAGMLYYFPQIWTSDNTDAYDRMKIQWGTSVCYPVSAMSCHVSACPNHQTGRTSPFATRGAVASLGATGYELDISKLTEDEKSAVKAQTALYKKIDELVLKGDLYRILSPFEGNGFCEMLVSKDKKSAYLVYVRDKTCADCKTIRLKGLDGDKIYSLNNGVVANGRELMEIGLSVAHIERDLSCVWLIEEVV